MTTCSPRPGTRSRDSTSCRRPEFGSVAGAFLQILLDAQQLIVLGNSVGAAGGAGLDLAGVGGHDDVGNGRVFGFAAAMADDGSEAVATGQLDGIQSFRQRADLIDLDEDAVGRASVDAIL